VQSEAEQECGSSKGQETDRFAYREKEREIVELKMGFPNREKERDF
jgi:hypothetical protein